MAKRKKTTAEVAAPETVVYCGPSVKDLVRQYTVYSGGIPANLEAYLSIHPMAKALLVKESEFAAVRVALDTPGTREKTIYNYLLRGK